MKSTGVIRQIDSLGRVVIPHDLRRALDLEVRDSVEFFSDDGQIILRKYTPLCMFCGEGEKLITFNGRCICKKCAESMAILAEQAE